MASIQHGDTWVDRNRVMEVRKKLQSSKVVGLSWLTRLYNLAHHTIVLLYILLQILLYLQWLWWSLFSNKGTRG